MPGIFFRRGVGFGHSDQLQKTKSIGVGIAPLARNRVPIVIAEGLGVLGPEIAEMAEAIVVADDVFRLR